MNESAGGQSTITSCRWEILSSKRANYKYIETIISNYKVATVLQGKVVWDMHVVSLCSSPFSETWMGGGGVDGEVR